MLINNKPRRRHKLIKNKFNKKKAMTRLPAKKTITLNKFKLRSMIIKINKI